MHPTRVPSIRFNIPESLTNIMRDPHGLHMLGLLARANVPGSEHWLPRYIEECPDDVGRKMFEDYPHDGPHAPRIMTRGWLPDTAIEEVATAIVKQTLETPISNRLLASPKLSKKAVIGLMSLSHGKPSSIHASLYANPNYPDGIAQGSALPSKYRGAYIEALAEHGDLKDPEVVSLLTTDLLTSPTGALIVGDNRATQKRLAARPDLPIRLAWKLDSLGDASIYGTLIKNPTHQEAVRDGNVEGTNLNTDGVRQNLQISPAVSAESLGEIWKTVISLPNATPQEVEKRELAMAAIAAHKNSTDIMRETVRSKAKSVTDQYVRFLRENTHPETDGEIEWLYYRDCKECPLSIATISTIAPQILFNAAREIATANTNDRDTVLLALCSNPNFPWNEVEPESKINVVTEGEAPFACCKALGGALSHRQLLENLASPDPIPALFSPSLTGFRLEKLAMQHPSLAMPAALHPNGQNVSIEQIPEEQRRFVARHRQEAELSGKSNAKVAGNALTIEI